MAISVTRTPVRVGPQSGVGYVHRKSESLFRDTFLREVASRDMALQLRLETTILDRERQQFVFQPQHRQQYVSRVLSASVASPATLPTRLLLNKLFAAYCGFLADKRWVYESTTGMHKATLSDPEKEIIDTFYGKDITTVSPFMLPGRPHLNCMEAAHGLVYAMAQLRIPASSISVVHISADTRHHGIIFRGFDNAMGVVQRIKYYHLSEVGLTVSLNGRGVASVRTHQDTIDAPFDNHFFVECDGVFWDPTYGIAFSTIDWVFTTCQEWVMLNPSEDQHSQTRDLLYRCPELHKWIAVLNTASRSSRAQAILANPAAERYLFANEDAVTRRLGVDGGAVDVPLSLWRVLADGIPAMRDCLGNAVTRYEADSAFWRTPSTESKRALWSIRKYLGWQALAGLSTKKRAEYYPASITQDASVWTDEQAADFTQRVLSGTGGVGKRLGEAIKKACQGNAAVASLFG